MLASSCKKDKIEEVRPKTVADFEKIMAIDKDFTSFISSSLELEDLALSKSKPSFLLQNNSTNPRKVLTSAELEELKKVKSFDEMRNYLNGHQIENATKIVDILEKQSISFYNFVVKYPEYSKLSTKEKALLIGNSLKSHDKLDIPLSFSSSGTQGKLMKANAGGDPLQAYGIAIQGCQDSYRTAFTAATATADIALLASLTDPTGIAYAASLLSYVVVIYYLDQERGNCMNLAASLLFNELS